MSDAGERIQKLLARAGITSRRKAEDLILEGVVTVNGKIAVLGQRARWGEDSIKVRGKLVNDREPLLYLAFNKPKEVICSLQDPEGRPHLGNYLTRVKSRVYPVGRLDFMSEGLLLLTNDGDFAQKLQQSSELVRTYMVKVKGHPDEEQIERIRRGGRVNENSGAFKPVSVRVAEKLNAKTVLQITLTGSSASVDLKAFLESRGFLVDKLSRSSIGHLTLKGLAPGEFRYLKDTQAQALLTQPELGRRAAADAVKPERPRRPGDAPELTAAEQKERRLQAKRDAAYAAATGRRPTRPSSSNQRISAARPSATPNSPKRPARGAKPSARPVRRRGSPPRS